MSDVEAASTQTHLQMLQGIITRMAASAANCKAWCVALIGALSVLAFDRNKPQVLLVGYFFVVVFFALDVYYLAVEKSYRDRWDVTIQALKDKKTIPDLFVMSSTVSGANVGRAMSSVSTWPVYVVLAGALFLARYLIP
jgi:hypothetical protein